MPNDAKLGLVVGVALVIAVAVVFFRKDGPARLAVSADPSPAAAPADATPQAAPRNEIPAAPASRVKPGEKAHVIQPGDTLYSIAKQHYGDGDEFFRIYKANREMLKNPDQLPVGQTLSIP